MQFSENGKAQQSSKSLSSQYAKSIPGKALDLPEIERP